MSRLRTSELMDRMTANKLKLNPYKTEVYLDNWKTGEGIGIQPVLDGGYNPPENSGWQFRCTSGFFLRWMLKFWWWPGMLLHS